MEPSSLVSSTLGNDPQYIRPSQKRSAAQALLDEKCKSPAMPSSLMGIFEASQRKSTAEDLERMRARIIELDNMQANKLPSPTPELQYFDKRPLISNGCVSINGLSYPIEKIGEGPSHRTFKFSGSEKLELGDRTLLLQKCVLKILNPLMVPYNTRKQHKDDKTVYDYLQSLNVPMPEVHTAPQTFVDSIEPKNGGFWIVDKMDRSASCEEWANPQTRFEDLSPDNQALLAFVKHYLTISDRDQEIIINDFYSKNVMFGKGQWRVVDSTIVKGDNWQITLTSYVKHWSNGNPNILAYLTSDFINTKPC